MLSILRKGSGKIAQQSLAKVRVSAINQVSLVVKDIQKSVEGIFLVLVPGSFMPMRLPWFIIMNIMVSQLKAKARLAFTRIGGIQLELIQTIVGNSIYNDFIMEGGEGLHHFNFLVDDVSISKSVSLLEQESFPCVQRVRLGDNGTYAYIDMKPLKVIVGLVNSNSLSWF